MSDQLDALRGWILSRNPELHDLDPDTDIIESRIIDSLQFVEMLLYVEELRGAEIDEETLNIEFFRTLNQIDRNFLSALSMKASQQR
ncbi:MAG: acyl carrier protein [Trebonia sp.]